MKCLNIHINWIFPFGMFANLLGTVNYYQKWRQVTAYLTLTNGFSLSFAN